ACTRPRHGDAGPRGVVLALAEWHDHVQAVDGAALEDRDQHLAPRRAGRLDGSREERGRESEADEREAAALEEHASGQHGGYLRWNSGEPSVSAADWRGSVVLASVDAVAGEMSPASAEATSVPVTADGSATGGSTPRIRPFTSASAKFMRSSS